VESSRGCGFSCKFCSIDRNLRFKSPSKVIKEIEFLKEKFNVGWIEFSDTSFGINKKLAFEICNLLIKNKLDIEWGCQMRCELLDRGLIKKMYKAGCRLISFGVESGSERVRKFAGKKTSNYQVKKAFKLCRESGIKTGALFILGLPSETYNEMLCTIKLAKNLQADYYNFNPLELFPDTEFLKTALKENKINGNSWNNYINGGRIPIYIPDGFTRQELKKIIELAYRKTCFNSRYFLNKLKDIKTLNDLKKYYNYLRNLTKQHDRKFDFNM
jgi:radical SAM superfamily enzyme YgiQ (UPF0313 family)